MTPGSSGDALEILVVDDEPMSRTALVECFVDTEHRVEAVATADEALDRLDDGLYDVAFVDLRLEHGSGLDLLSEALRRAPWLKVVIVTAYGSVESAVSAVREGAVDFLEKPFQPAHVRALAGKLLAVRRQERRAAAIESETGPASASVLLASDDPAMRKILSLARKAADSTATILLVGESGTGKTVLARAIHQWSDRHEGPFSVVSCPSLSEELLRSELFGHVKGAFTGAMRSHRGRIETTEGGTLFLDEVADLPLPIQPQLLRFIQERRYERVGSTETRTADVRLVAATNRDLEARVRTGEFREDLYYRLDVIGIRVPPLRDRPSDIVPLAERFLYRFADENNRRLEGFTEAARSRLRAYAWPGNVRELENAVERAVILVEGHTVGAAFLPDPSGSARGTDESAAPSSGLRTLQEMERAHIRHALETCDTVKEAAEALGISKTTLWRRRKKYDV